LRDLQFNEALIFALSLRATTRLRGGSGFGDEAIQGCGTVLPTLDRHAVNGRATMRPSSPKAEETRDGQHDDDKPNQIDDPVHDALPREVMVCV
jgi:hypothetical protein